MSGLRCEVCPVDPGEYCHGTADRGCCTRARSGRPLAAKFVRDRSYIEAYGTPPLAEPPPDPVPIGEPYEPDAGRARVGLLMPVANHGGAERWQELLIRSVDPTAVAWQGCVVTGGPDAALPEVVETYRARMPVGFGRIAARRLAARCDVLVTWAVPNLDTILTGLNPRPRVVAVCHAPAEPTWAAGLFREPWTLDVIVAVSELALGPVPASLRPMARVITNAVDAARLEPTRAPERVRAGWGIPAGARVVGYYGRISDEKDPYALERAVAALPADWWGVAVGSSLWGQRGPAGDRIRWVGPDDRAGDVLRAFDVHLAASQYESFGLSLAEGLWLGVPTVSTPVGIAKLVPGLTEPVPIDADGPTLARAIRAAAADTVRPVRVREWARRELAPARFGTDWTRLLIEQARMVEPGPVPRAWWADAARAKALKDRVNSCSARTPFEGCGCDGWCDNGRGTSVPDPTTNVRRSLVTLDDCLRCDLVPST